MSAKVMVEQAREAVGFSHNFATAKPNINDTEQVHILGLCRMVTKLADYIEAADKARGGEAVACRPSLRKALEKIVDHGEGEPVWIDPEDAERLLAPHPADGVDKWQPIETVPHGQAVLIHYKNTCGRDRVIKACYFRKFTHEASEEHSGIDWAEYDEGSDTYYVPEGWYEQIDNWDDLTACALDSANVPTHWQPLPVPPQHSKGRSDG